MVYLRSKKVKNDQYLYLVQSVWDSKKSTSRQEIIKYLGKSSLVTLEDIPSPYRNDDKITSFFLSHKNNLKNSNKSITKYQKDLLKFLQDGDLQKSLDVYAEYGKTFGIAEFYENILRPVMYEVGELWAENKISMATEHVCSNVVRSLMNIIRYRSHTSTKQHMVLICTPMGEEHSIGCTVLESYLSSKGFSTLNLSPSVPSSSILSTIKEKNPKAVLVSITLEDNLKTGQRLVKKIKNLYDIPVIVGGQAVINNDLKFDAIVSSNNSLNSILKLLKSSSSA